jgi:hypothetical protein
MSFLPPVNTFGMLSPHASNRAAPWWQVWLSIGVGGWAPCLSPSGLRRVFRIWLLMYGKPPSLGTFDSLARIR